MGMEEANTECGVNRQVRQARKAGMQASRQAGRQSNMAGNEKQARDK